MKQATFDISKTENPYKQARRIAQTLFKRLQKATIRATSREIEINEQTLTVRETADTTANTNFWAFRQMLQQAIQDWQRGERE